jgi:hypothetical protein
LSIGKYFVLLLQIIIMKYLLVFAMFTFSINFSFCQKDSKPVVKNKTSIILPPRLELYTSFWSKPEYKIGEHYVNENEFKSNLMNNKEAFEIYKSSASTQGIANVFAGLGGFLLGWNIGDLLFSKEKDKNFVLGSIGLGIIAIGIPIENIILSKKRTD